MPLDLRVEEGLKRLRERGKGPERVRVKVVYGLTPAEAVILSLSENWEQHSITEEEKGRALARLVEEYGYRPEQLAESLARSVREIEGLLSIIGLGRVATRGRPRKEERAERINPDAGILAQNLTEYLMKEGVVEEAEKEEFEEELLETVKGLPGQSVRKVFKTVKQRVAEEKKERGEIPSKEEVREIAKEVAEKERRKVSRVVLLDVEVVRAVNAYAKSLQTDFNEALETLARERLSQLGYL